MLRKAVALLLLIAFATAGMPLSVWGAGDASAIRRATRPEDSRYVSNYRPYSRAASYNSRTRGTISKSSTATTSRATIGCRGR